MIGKRSRRLWTCAVAVCVLLLAVMAVADANDHAPATRLQEQTGDVTVKASARLRGAGSWCVRADLAQGELEGGIGRQLYPGHTQCGSSSRGTATAVTSACPFGVGITAVLSGERPVTAYDNRSRPMRVPQRRVRDHRGATATFFVIFARVSDLPATIRRRSARRETTIAKLPSIDDHC